MGYFTQEYINFFKELSGNNSREWFHSNKKRYEEHVKEPFEQFTNDMIEKMREVDPEVQITAKDAIFRIHRDIRFSKDKSPYKTHMAAIISAGGKKNKTVPGLYCQFGPDEVRIYSGIHMLEKDDLNRLRQTIAQNLGEFQSLYRQKEFSDNWGEIHGEKNKRLPSEFQEAAEAEPLLFNKSFYYFQKYPSDFLLNEDICQNIIDQYKIAKPLGDFLTKALQA